jgi:SOS-response transcriptional repressor LexA
LKIDFERRPTPSEVLQAGYLPMTVSGEHSTWFHFCLGENDLTLGEQNCLEQYGAWFEMLQTTNLTKSYKMIVLRVLLDQQTFWEGLGVEDLSEKCHQYLKNHPVLRQDLEGAGYKEGSQSDEKGAFMEWWLKWPLNRWADRQGDRKWFQFDGDKFSPSFKCEIHLQDAFEFMTGELVDYRLAQYSRKRLSKDQGWDNEGAGFSFMAKVSHSNGKAILFLPTLESNPQRPLGPKEVSLPDGSTWIFKFVKVACNIAYPKSTDENSENQLSQLLKIWFGDNAGLPGTNFEVEFREENLDGNKKWTVKPINLSGTSIQKRFYSEKGNAKADTGYPFYFSETIPKDQGDSYYVPVFNLNVAAGLWGPESTPEAIGWAKLDGKKVETGMFVAQVMGHSMEPKIPDKSWCVFRKPKPGSRQNKIVLVQFNSLGDPENGGRFTVKKYQSEKRVSPEGWEHQAVRLVPMNPEYAAIEIQPDNAGELLIVGEFVQVLSGD